MPSLSTRATFASILSVAILTAPATHAQDPPPPKPEGRTLEDAIKPRPPVAIPDDPPPHEGAMIDIAYLIEPPDILVVEVLEALPGRPITGEHLVQQDGMISLGFYGRVHVRGLTPEQAKVKVILHLRSLITDEVLGLVQYEQGNGPIVPLPKPGTVVPNLDPPVPPHAPPGKVETPNATRGPEPDPKPDPPVEDQPKLSRRGQNPTRSAPDSIGRQARMRREARRLHVTRRATSAVPTQDPKPTQPKNPPAPMPDGGEPGKYVYVDPVESIRVFVDVSSYNSKTYYVQGDVGTPGRLPVTGKETVLDALNYAGGFLPSAEPTDVHLHRPERGGKPAKDYRIDLAAIRRGDAKANLQIFEGDRLVVGRNAIVQKAVELDRIGAPINSILNSILQHSFSARSVGNMGQPATGNVDVKVAGQPVGSVASDGPSMTAAVRDQNVKEWAEFLWDLSNKEAKKTLDEKTLREALLQKLAPAPAKEPEKK